MTFRVPYWLKLGLMVVTLGAGTAAFVLVVLPQRFVLQAGLRSSGVSFPARAVTAEPSELVMVEPRSAPPAVPVEGDEAPETTPAPPPEPGPAERFWAAVLPVLEAGDPAAALPLFDGYLAEHPDDHSVRLEHGVALAGAGRLEAAEAAFREVAGATGEGRARLELAHLLRDRGRPDESAALLGELSAERPDDHGLRLELARVLWAAGRIEESVQTATSVPPSAAEGREADELLALIAASLTPPDEPAADPDPPPDPVALARAAVEQGDPELALELYAVDLAGRPDDPAILLEWADFFQYVTEDYEAALEALERRARLEPPSTEDRLRLARLYAWTERAEAATAELTALLEREAGLAEGWALLGDLRRWRGARVAAADAYDRALDLQPDEPQALVGREALRAATDEAIAGQQEVGLGPVLSYFRDSQGYRRLTLTARAALLQSGRTGVTVSSGFERLEGSRPGSARAAEEGLFGELELARWWREGTVRAAVTGGVERFETLGAEPLFGLRLEAADPDRGGVDVQYRHGRAYPLVTTLESVDMEVRADNLSVGWHLRLPRELLLSGSLEAGLFRAGPGDNRRLAAGLGLRRQITPSFDVGLASRVLGYSDAAPEEGFRRAYWDPELFWATEVPVELRLPSRRGWTAYVRASPGVGLVRERSGADSEWIPQMSGLGGVRYLGERALLDADLFHARGREGEYNSLGLSLRVTVRR